MPARYLDRDGQPITALQADTLLGDRDYRTIAATDVGPRSGQGVAYHVLTEWTATGPDVDGLPTPFETRVYAGGEIDDQHTRRYISVGHARSGHRDVVAAVAATVPGARIDDSIKPA